jgi:FKBP-type peptidyl-prolyl cis-trans isomerase 2
MTVSEGDTIKIEYKGTLDDGTEFDNSEKHGKPLEFTVGAKQVIKGFDDAVRGMEKGESKKFRLEPTEAYGDPNPQLVKKVPKEQLPKEQDPVPGMVLGVTLPNGQQIPATITEVEEAIVIVDMNHPLAGKALTFDITIVEA